VDQNLHELQEDGPDKMTVVMVDRESLVQHDASDSQWIVYKSYSFVFVLRKISKKFNSEKVRESNPTPFG
jgi:hypothetical protein